MITKGDGPDPRISHLEEINNRRNMPAETEYRRKNKEKLERLRDEFAMAALSGMVACEYVTTVNAKSWAQDAYRVSDAMLKAREVQS